MVREASEELEKQKAKKKKGLPDSVNPDDYIPKLNLEMVNKIFSWRLARSDCKNKGYVLENYPVTRAEAAELFIEKIPVKNEIIDEIDTEGPGHESGNRVITSCCLAAKTASAIKQGFQRCVGVSRPAARA